MLHLALSTEDATDCSNPFTFNYDIIGENQTLGREIKNELPALMAPSWLAGQWMAFVSLGKAMRLSILQLSLSFPAFFSNQRFHLSGIQSPHCPLVSDQGLGSPMAISESRAAPP